MRERLAQRDAYKRGKDEDNQLIAEMQAAGVEARSDQADGLLDAELCNRRSSSTTASPTKAWTAAISLPG